MLIRILIVITCVSVVVDARCKTNRKQCHTNSDCCSGCCDTGICSKHSYCVKQDGDVCENHRCLDQETCLPYYDEDCEEDCKPLPMCQVITLASVNSKKKHSRSRYNH